MALDSLQFDGGIKHQIRLITDVAKQKHSDDDRDDAFDDRMHTAFLLFRELKTVTRRLQEVGGIGIIIDVQRFSQTAEPRKLTFGVTAGGAFEVVHRL